MTKSIFKKVQRSGSIADRPQETPVKSYDTYSDVQSFEEYLDKAQKSAESKRVQDAFKDLKPGFTF